MIAQHLEEMAWNEIQEPGCYLMIESGEFARVFPEALSPGHAPILITSVKGSRVAKLSHNPTEPISSLRIVAADHGYRISF